MPHSNGKIFSAAGQGVDLVGDIAATLGSPLATVEGLCRDPRINPASKIKPVRGFGLAPIAAADFGGTVADRSAGIFYGVKAATRYGDLPSLHDCDYSYVGLGDGDWARMTDFDGYCHNARFSPEGALEEWFYADIAPMPVTIRLADTQGGISLDDIIRLYDSASSDSDLAHWWPCALVSDTARTEHWAVALKRADNKQNSTMTTADGARIADWLLDVTDLSHNGDTSPEAFLSQTGGRLVTVFFVREILNTPLGINLARWTKVTDTYVFQSRTFACPGAAGVTVDFRKFYVPAAQVDSVSALVSGTTRRYTVSGTWLERHSDSEEYEFRVTVRSLSNGVWTQIDGFSFTLSYEESQGLIASPGHFSVIHTSSASVWGASGTAVCDWEVRSGERTLNSGSVTLSA